MTGASSVCVSTRPVGSSSADSVRLTGPQSQLSNVITNHILD